VILHAAKLAEYEMIEAYSVLMQDHDEDEDDSPDPPPPHWAVTDPSLEPARLKREFHAILQEECARVEGLLAAHEADEPEDDAVDLVEQAAFDDSAEGERLHRYQNHWSRSLLRTLDTIAKLRQNGDEGVTESDLAPDECGARSPGERATDPERTKTDASATRNGAREEDPDGPIASAQIKATATTESRDHERTYAVAKQNGKSLGERPERRPERGASDDGGPFLAQAGSADPHAQRFGTTFAVEEDSIQPSPAGSGVGQEGG
jgi:hypothetical protein